MQLSTHLLDFVFRVLFRIYRPLKLPLSCEVVEKRYTFCTADLYRGRGYPTFWTCVFKLHLLPCMWPIIIEFRSESSEGSGEKKKEERRIPIKIGLCPLTCTSRGLKCRNVKYLDPCHRCFGVVTMLMLMLVIIMMMIGNSDNTGAITRRVCEMLRDTRH